jgi:hypothetical protein
MKKILLCAFLVLAFAATSFAIPARTQEFQAEKEIRAAEEDCWLYYYNRCTTWMWGWGGYCYFGWIDAGLMGMNPSYGTCFNLMDCDWGCRNLTQICWGAFLATEYGINDVEIYCANDCCAPIGEPLAGVYGIVADQTTYWHYVDFGSLELCPCEEPGFFGKFIVMVTDRNPLSDCNVPLTENFAQDMAAGCMVWDCFDEHSFVFVNGYDYVLNYGMPCPLWVSGPGYGCYNFPAIPPGCHNYFYSTGGPNEWLIDAYITCLGPTATESSSWSEIKSLYK